MSTEGEKWRANYVPSLAYYHLDQACAVIGDAFGFCCYLVGSSLSKREWRDVDVRLIMDDASYDLAFPRDAQGRAKWSLLMVAISTWLKDRTGLPVDFQIQRRTEANRDHPGTRSALGIFLHYPGELPPEPARPSPKEDETP